MSLEDSILVLAEAVQELAVALAATNPPLALELAPVAAPDAAQTSINDFSITEGWPTGSEHGNFGKKKRCSICGKVGVNKRTHYKH